VDEADFSLEEESPPGYRSDDLLGIIRQGLPDVSDALGDGFVRDHDASPHGLHEFLARDQAAMALDEVPQHMKGLGAELDLTRPTDQAFRRRLEREFEKRVRTVAMLGIGELHLQPPTQDAAVANYHESLTETVRSHVFPGSFPVLSLFVQDSRKPLKARWIPTVVFAGARAESPGDPPGRQCLKTESPFTSVWTFVWTSGYRRRIDGCYLVERIGRGEWIRATDLLVPNQEDPEDQ
jgi:hypothetical protein